MVITCLDSSDYISDTDVTDMDSEWIAVAVALLCGVGYFLVKQSEQKQNLKRKLLTARQKREAGIEQAQQAVSHFKAEVTQYVLLLKHFAH